MLTLRIILILVLLTIAFYDIKERLVYWWLYALLFIGICLFIYITKVYTNAFIQIGYNISILVIQFIVVQLYFIVKKGRFELLFHKMIGIGDVIFFLCLSVFLPTLVFIPFLVVALLLSLGLHFVFLLLNRNYLKTVPLAGFLSLFLIPVVIWYENIEKLMLQLI